MQQAATRARGSGSMSTRSVLPILRQHSNTFLKQVLPQQPATRSTMAAFSPVKGGPHGHLHGAPATALAALRQTSMGSPCSQIARAAAVAMHTIATLERPSDTANLDPHHAPFHTHPAAHRAQPRVQLIYGPMFAGKSTELLKRTRQARDQKKTVLVVKSALDKRYEEGHVCTHDKDHVQCHVTLDLMSVPRQLGQGYHQADVVAIDEAQFFPDLLEFVKMAAHQHQKTVLVAGLDLDYRKEPFGQVLQLAPLAGPDGMRKLTAKCHAKDCKHDAVYSMRIIKADGTVVIGGKEQYVATCEHHYKLLQ